MISKKQLLCTFTNSEKYQDVVNGIKSTYTIAGRELFLFTNEKNSREIYITFNIIKDSDSKIKYPNTIGVHRKKQTNTLYTLNAMNRLIIDENNGVFDKTFQLNWELYKNSIILISDPGVKVVGLKLLSIISA